MPAARRHPAGDELAAARTAALGIEELFAGLDDRFQLLTGGRRTALPRHQTLRATLDWSYELLAEPERVILRRLVVFAGVFSLEAASAIVASPEVAPSEVVDGLTLGSSPSQCFGIEAVGVLQIGRSALGPSGLP